MKRLLQQIQDGTDLVIGNWTIHVWDNGTLGTRQTGSGLLGPDARPNVAGLRRLLSWLDQQPL